MTLSILQLPNSTFEQHCLSLENTNKAVEYAESAILILQKEYGNGDQILPPGQNNFEIAFKTQAKGYFNLGVEYEHLKQFEYSFKAYLSSLRLAEIYMKDDVEFIKYLNKSINTVNMK